MVRVDSDAESDSDLLWAAIAGLRSDVERLVGRVERFAAASGPDKGTAEEHAEAWRAAQDAESERLKKARAAQGKGEELDEADLEALGNAWLCG